MVIFPLWRFEVEPLEVLKDLAVDESLPVNAALSKRLREAARAPPRRRGEALRKLYEGGPFLLLSGRKFFLLVGRRVFLGERPPGGMDLEVDEGTAAQEGPEFPLTLPRMMGGSFCRARLVDFGHTEASGFQEKP